MAHQDFDAYRSSQLCRKPSSKSTRRLLQLSLTGDRIAPPQESFYGERRKGTSAVARVIFVIVLLHILFIGGTFLHKKLQSEESAAAANTTPPPSQMPVEVAPTITPLPIAKTDEADKATQPDAATITGNITPTLPQVSPAPILPPVQTSSAVNKIPAEPAEITAVEIPEVQAIDPAPSPAPAIQAAPAPAPAPPVVVRTIKHKIVPNDTWYSLAKKHKITIEQLRAANPVDGKKETVYAGKTVLIPVYGPAPAGSASTAAAAPTSKVAPAKVKTHTVASGDTLYAISKKNKVDFDTVLKLNNIEKKDAGKIKIGQKIKLAE
ncbi:MAG: LysM peptidoglycan-binding domain-containing protein [Akkermansia sp.]